MSLVSCLNVAVAGWQDVSTIRSRYTIRYNIVCLTCSKKVMCSQSATWDKQKN